MSENPAKGFHLFKNILAGGSRLTACPAACPTACPAAWPSHATATPLICLSLSPPKASTFRQQPPPATRRQRREAHFLSPEIPAPLQGDRHRLRTCGRRNVSDGSTINSVKAQTSASSRSGLPLP